MNLAAALLLSLANPSVAVAQSPAPAAASAPAASGPSFGGLFVSWSSAARQALENEAAERARQEAEAAAAAAGARQDLSQQDEGRVLGERVGEVVRGGDCAGGERMAQEAGDIALVQAVRDYCRR